MYVCIKFYVCIYSIALSVLPCHPGVIQDDLCFDSLAAPQKYWVCRHRRGVVASLLRCNMFQLRQGIEFPFVHIFRYSIEIMETNSTYLNQHLSCSQFLFFILHFHIPSINNSWNTTEIRNFAVQNSMKSGHARNACPHHPGCHGDLMKFDQQISIGYQ